MKKDLTRSMILHNLLMVALVIFLFASPQIYADQAGQRQGPPREQGQSTDQDSPAPPPEADCPPEGHVVGRTLGYLLHQLNLSKAQCDKIVPLLEAERAKVDSILAQHGVKRGERPTREQMDAIKDQIRPIQEATRAMIEKILTQDQLKQLHEMEADICSQTPPRGDDQS